MALRKPKIAPAAPAKRARNSVTCGELDAAINAAIADMDHCSARETLEALWDLTDNKTDGDIVKLDGPAPVTMEAFDEALAEAQDGLPASTLRPLKRVRALLEASEAQKAKEPVQYLTVAQAKSRDEQLFDAFAWALGAMVEELDRGQPSQSHVLDVLQRSASSPERKKVFNGISEFRAADVRKRTQEEFLRYQSKGHW